MGAGFFGPLPSPNFLQISPVTSLLVVCGWDPMACPLEEDSLLHSLDSAVFKTYFINDDETMKVKVLVTQACPTLCNSVDCSHQAPLSIELYSQEHWSGLPFPSIGDLPNPAIEPASPPLASGFFTTDPSGKPCINRYQHVIGEQKRH